MSHEDWFICPTTIKEVKPQKPKRYISPVPTTGMSRILENVNLKEERWAKNNLYCSQIGDPYWDMGESIVQFWRPYSQKKNIYSQIYMEQSTIKHAIIQEFWHATGLLHPLHGQDEFKEIKVRLESHGLSGKIDLVLPDQVYLKDLGSTKPKGLKQTGWSVGDIKECSSKVYSSIQTNIPDKYRTQVSLYHYWGVKEGITTKKDKSFFYYLNRDNPRQFKWVQYEPEQDLVDAALKKADLFWQHIRNRTHPTKKDFAEFCEESIKQQPDREWNPLAEIKVEN